MGLYDHITASHAVRTTEALRSTPFKQGLAALFLGLVVHNKIDQTVIFLELHLVFSQGISVFKSMIFLYFKTNKKVAEPCG
jgi:hypothetical protein